LVLIVLLIDEARSQTPPIRRLDVVRSGIEFAGASVRAMQADDFTNPGMLWVERGEALWKAAPASGQKSCAGCHGDVKTAMRGAATRYPQIDRTTGELLNLEGRINQCVTQRQGAAVLAYESESLIGLTALVATQSRSMPIAVSIEGAARPHFESGQAFYLLRQGHVNLSCSQCHDQNHGRTLLAEPISQGHGNAYPIYRLEWQAAGSLHRRFRSCLSGVRAELLPQGSPTFLDLELYLAWRAQGLPIETPGVRR
jgi:sulfur-oxidizing protein SoxA